MNRLTDEQLKEMCDPNLYAIRERTMAQEILELRRENERLKAKVLLGDELASECSSLLNHKYKINGQYGDWVHIDNCETCRVMEKVKAFKEASGGWAR